MQRRSGANRGQSGTRFRTEGIGRHRPVPTWQLERLFILISTMHRVCGVEVTTDKPRFADRDQQMWVSPLFGALCSEFAVKSRLQHPNSLQPASGRISTGKMSRVRWLEPSLLKS